MSSSPTRQSEAELLAKLRTTVGRRHVLTSRWRTARYRTGYRFGTGEVVAVVRPGSLIELWRALQICVAAETVVIPQASNTGLTGGSTPCGQYDRPVVVVQMMRLGGIHLIGEGSQAVCLPGATLSQLEGRLAPLQRDPHSVIGSSCIGASVVGGVCNNSGGALVNRGPAFTKLAIYARVADNGLLELVNHIGIMLGSDPETILHNLERGKFADDDVIWPDDGHASDREYAEHVRKIDEATPARYNANPRNLFEGSGSAGKIILFAVRLDTFPKAISQRMYYIGSNDPDELTELRRALLSSDIPLPVSAEYMHRGAFDCADAYGKDTFLAVTHLGPTLVRQAFGLKRSLDGMLSRLSFLPPGQTDRILQRVARWFPDQLPPRLREWRDRFEHHLLLQMSDAAIAPTEELLRQHFPSQTGDMFVCSKEEAQGAMSHRFAVASAAIRFRALHPDLVEDIVALDVALPRNERNWFEKLPGNLNDKVVQSLFYGHFFCHVLHQDYIIKKGAATDIFKEIIFQKLDSKNCMFPAEHSFGHVYKIDDFVARHYKSLDPLNIFNPGLGKTSRNKFWH